MNERLSDSELILNADGSVYHLHLLPEQVAETIIVVGDPDRVAKVSKYWDAIDFQIQKREFVTHTGRIGSKKISAISSGIGTDNVEILMTELDALFNIDLETRKIKTEKKSLQIIRIGTSGSLQAAIPVDSLLVSVQGLGLDNLMSFYQLPQSESEIAFAQAIQNQTNIPLLPYMVNGSEKLKDQFGKSMLEGITLTCSGFYAPQGRSLRNLLAFPDLISQLSQMETNGLKLTNFEMETAAYYAFARLLGHEAISLNAILANRISNQFSINPEKIVDKLIQKVLSEIG